MISNEFLKYLKFSTLARGEVALKLDILVIFSFKIIDIFKAEVESFKMYQVISRRKKKLKKCHKQQIERLLLISYLMKSPPFAGRSNIQTYRFLANTYHCNRVKF